MGMQKGCPLLASHFSKADVAFDGPKQQTTHFLPSFPPGCANKPCWEWAIFAPFSRMMLTMMAVMESRVEGKSGGCPKWTREVEAK